MDAQKVGKRIQEVRKARGLTQAELSQMLDLSTKYISNIECGFKTPKLNTFVAIANALKCDANQLLSDVLDVTTGQESGQVSEKLLSLPAEEQRRILRVLEVMIEEARCRAQGPHRREPAEVCVHPVGRRALGQGEGHGQLYEGRSWHCLLAF